MTKTSRRARRNRSPYPILDGNKLRVTPSQFGRLQASIARGDNRVAAIATWLRRIGLDPADFYYRDTEVVVEYPRNKR